MFCSLTTGFVLLTLFGCAPFSGLKTSLVSPELTYYQKRDALIFDTPNYEIEFRLGAVTYIENKLTDEVYTASSDKAREPCLIGASAKPKRINFPKPYRVKIARNGDLLDYRVENKTGEIFAAYALSFEKKSGDLLVNQEGSWPGKDIKGICFDVTNVNLSNVSIILPADGGVIHTRLTPVSTAIYDWPSIWQAGFAIGQGKSGGFNIWAQDKEYLFKTLYYRKDSGLASLSFETQNPAPFSGKDSVRSVTWRVNTYKGEWNVPVQNYQRWLLDKNPDFLMNKDPEWVRHIQTVIISHFPPDEPGRDRLLNYLEILSQEIDPAKILLYVPTGWRRDEYDVNYPDYTPKEWARGYIERLQSLGLRVMLHVNTVGVSPNHPLFGKYENVLIRHPITHKLVGWQLEFGDRVKRKMAFLDPASDDARKTLVQAIRTLYEKLKSDAIHMDGPKVCVNDDSGIIDGKNCAQGLLLYFEELKRSMPGLVLSTEGIDELLIDTSFSQFWYFLRNKDERFGQHHPVSTYLFEAFNRSYGHLSNPNPVQSLYGYLEVQDMDERFGALPTWFLGFEDISNPRLYPLLKKVKFWNREEPSYDFSSARNSNEKFVYETQSGKRVSFIEDGTGKRLVAAKNGREETIYHILSGVSHYETGGSIPGWIANKDNKGVFGLNPRDEYILLPRRGVETYIEVTKLSHNAAISLVQDDKDISVVRFEAISEDIDEATMEIRLKKQAREILLADNDIGKVELIDKGTYQIKTRLPQSVILIYKEVKEVKAEVLPLYLRDVEARVYNLTSSIMDSGVELTKQDWVYGRCGDITKIALRAFPPRQGRKYIQYVLRLPEKEKLGLYFSFGLDDDSEGYLSDGATFIIEANEKALFQKFIPKASGWQRDSLDLSEYAGGTVVLNFITDSKYWHYYDKAYWTDLKLFEPFDFLSGHKN